MKVNGNGLDILDRAECLALLRTVSLGRVVFTDRALPAIQPVGFTLAGDGVLIVAPPDSKLVTAKRDTVVAFEADDVDAATHTGWSVTVIGYAHAVRAATEAAPRPGLPPPAWSLGHNDRLIRIDCEQITGRRIRLAVPCPAGLV